LPLLSSLEGVSFRFFGKVAPLFLKRVFEFEDYLQRADMRIYPETYVSLMFFVAMLTLPVSIVGLVLLSVFKLVPLIFLVPMPLFVMIGFILVPMSKASERSQRLEREMPFAATYVAVMASGGIPPYTSVKRISEAALLPAMSQEARNLMRDVEIFGVDPLTAMQKSAKTNPLDIYKEFIGGYASTVIIGGDITSFLETKAKELFKTRAARVKAAAERLGMLLESFIIIMVLMSLCFYILFSVESIYSTGGMSSLSGIIMYTYVFTPLLSFVFIYLAHGMQPKSPITDWRPYKAFGICAGIAAGMLAVLTNMFGLMPVPFLEPFANIIDIPTAVALALTISAGPPAILQMKYAQEKSSTERGVTLFLQDLTETRKTGLAPEKCIETLSDREYGSFSKHLRKITAELSWGIPIRKVFMDFVRRTKSWATQIVMFLLVETVDVGGGTIAMIESLAKFSTTTQEVEREKKMAVKPYIMMPYFAALMLVATTVMMLTFTTKTVGLAGPDATTTIDLDSLLVVFSTSVIIHSYLIGLVGGKISEESVAAGFKHSALLTIIAIVAAKVAPSLISFY
jgi:flagellar protein FlaJ